MFRGKSDNFPALKGKAAEIRHAVGVLRKVFGDLCDRANKQHKQALFCLNAASTIEDLLDEFKEVFRLPAPAASTFEKTSFQFAQVQAALAAHYAEQNMCLFHVTLKSHDFLHIALQAKYINPRIGWCYTGEDMMAKAKAIAQSSFFRNFAGQAQPEDPGEICLRLGAWHVAPASGPNHPGMCA